MTSKSNQKALIYCRVSSKNQENQGGGLTSQEKRCRQYADFHHYKVEAVFKDAYSGGGDFMNRPAMRDLIEYVDGHSDQNYVVVFDDLKRFARDLKFHWELREAFHKRNLIPECLNFKFEETPEGSFIETILAAQGELERKQNTRQVIQKMKSRLERGIYCFSAPFGYRYVRNSDVGGKVLVLHDREAEVLQKVFSGFASGKLYHLKDVVKYVKAQSGINPYKNVSKYSVTKLLTNVLYTGYIEYETWSVSKRKGIHPAIITNELFMQVQERLIQKLPVRTRKDTREDFPLRGLVRCAHCNKAFTASWSTGRSKKYPFYRCKGEGCEWKNKSIARKAVHDHFYTYLRSLQPKAEIFNFFLVAVAECKKNTASKIAVKIRESEKELDMLNSEMKIITDRIKKTTNDSLVSVYEEELVQMVNRRILLTERINKPQRQYHQLLEPLSDKALTALKSPYKYWKLATLKQRRMYVSALFQGQLKYSRANRFGNERKPYLLRYFDSFGANLNQNFKLVDIDQKSWNQFLRELKNFSDTLKGNDNESRK